jgi:hypothetical protein
MHSEFRRIADDSGFCFWDGEEWAPDGAIIDWSTDYGSSIDEYSQRLVVLCSQLIQEYVDQRIPASQYASLLKKHFNI